MSDRKFRWGVLGTANIARQFCADLKALPDHELASVASRSAQRASDFCREFGGTPTDAYADLLDDPGLDGIYISLPNTLHAEWAIKCLKTGHAVLCEKPLAVSAAEAETMFAAAERAKAPLVEAFMYRCHPQTQAVLKAVRDGVIGQVRSIRASFSYRTNRIAGNVRFDPKLAGGALMDVGCYCLDFATQIAGAEATHVQAVSRRHERGIDVMTSGLIEYANGIQTIFTCGMDATADNSLIISGTDGYLTVAVPWKPTVSAGYTISRGTPPKQDLRPGAKAVTPSPEFVATPTPSPLYALEAEAFAATVRGKAEPFMPKEDSLRLARLLDATKAAASR